MRCAKLIIMTIVIASGLSFFYAHAEEPKQAALVTAVDESLYNKDTVPVDNTYACQVGNTSACEVPILLNKTTKKIEYYWSTDANGWVKSGDQQAALQALYDKREEIRTQRQLKRTQGEMDRHIRESMDEGQRNTPSRR